MKSSRDRIKTIGLVVEDVFSDFIRDIIHSVSYAVMDRKDLQLIILAGRQDESCDSRDMPHQYKIRYNQIYTIHEQVHFDGLLLTFPNYSRIRQDLFKKTPRVYLATELRDELTVNYDSEMGIREAIDYLVKIRGITRLCMLGGRDDNIDAQKRKYIFQSCLEDNGLPFSEKQYEKTDMSMMSQAAAARLLDRNPDTQAIFCVNDASAAGMYEVLHTKGLIPGRDIIVFGFDNTPLAADLNPPMASIGTDGTTLGKKALDMLLALMDGQKVISQTIPTRLYGRESLEYEIFEFTSREIMSQDNSFINNFFDNCFYRYRNEIVNPGAINLKRLFFEILSRMLKAMNSKILSEETYAEICRLIEILFENGIMLYTDPNRFVYNMARLQDILNEMMKPGFVTMQINRLFVLIKDKAIQFHSYQMRAMYGKYGTGRNNILNFLTWVTNYGKPGEAALNYLISQMDKLGLENAVLYLYKKPVLCLDGEEKPLPETMQLRCVIRNGELFVIPEERQECPVAEIYIRSELPIQKNGYVPFPLFYGKVLFGLLICTAEERLFEIGEFMTFQLGRAIFTNWVNPESM